MTETELEMKWMNVRNKAVRNTLEFFGVYLCDNCGAYFGKGGASLANENETVFTPNCERCYNLGFTYQENKTANDYF